MNKQDDDYVTGYYINAEAEANLVKELNKLEIPESKTDINQLLPYVGKYFKKDNYYYRPYLLEYHNEREHNKDWYLKGERLEYSDFTYHNQYHMMFFPNSDITHEITKKEFDDVNSKIKDKYNKYFYLSKNLPLETDVNKFTREEFKKYIQKSTLNKTYYLFHWITETAFRLEEIKVENGVIVDTLTHQITCEIESVKYKDEYWLQFFPGTVHNKHELSLHYKNGKQNFIWYLEKNRFIKIKNMIFNPLDYLK